METPPPLRPLIDDPEGVPDAEILLRVVPPGQFQGVDLLSGGFQDQSAEVAATHGLGGPCASVFVQSIWERDGGTVATLLEAFKPGSAIAKMKAGSLRLLENSLGIPQPHGVMLDPKPGPPGHAVIFCIGGARRSKGGMKAVREIAEWFWHPDS